MPTRNNPCGILSLLLLLINAPFMLAEQVEFLCFQGRLDLGVCQDGTIFMGFVGTETGPQSHDDEEAESLSLQFALDEEAEEKPHKRKKGSNDTVEA